MISFFFNLYHIMPLHVTNCSIRDHWPTNNWNERKSEQNGFSAWNECWARTTVMNDFFFFWGRGEHGNWSRYKQKMQMVVVGRMEDWERVMLWTVGQCRPPAQTSAIIVLIGLPLKIQLTINTFLAVNIFIPPPVYPFPRCKTIWKGNGRINIRHLIGVGWAKG